MIIYRVINKINGKCYIGQTKGVIGKRIIQHISFADKSNSVFHKALKKYGKESFDWEILVYCTSKSMLNSAEIFFIDRYNTKIPNGYNLTDGGYGILNPCSETRMKMIKNHADFSGDKHPMFGKHQSEKSNESRRKSLQGRHYHTKESKIKMGVWKDKHLSDDHKRKIGESVVKHWESKVVN